MKNLTVLNNEIFGKVRVIDLDGKVLFGATDSAKALGYKDPYSAINDHCKKDGLVNHQVIDSMGRQQKMNFITEGNLYRLISKSQLPSAEKFESWIFDEVLPDIRKNGMYATEDTIDNMLNNPDFAITLLTKYKEEKERAKQLEAENKAKDELLVEQGNKVSLLDNFLETDDLYTIDTFSKTMAIKGLGRNNLYEYLRDNKIIQTDIYIDKRGNKKGGLKHFTAYAQYTNSQQYFKHRQRNYQMGKETVKQNFVMLTAKGVEWLYKKLQKDGYVATKTLEQIVNELKEYKEVA